MAHASKCMPDHAVLLVCTLLLLVLSSANARVAIPGNSSWSLLAWGEAQPLDSVKGMFVVDVDIDEQRHLIAPLRERGHIVLCYFSVGTMEPWRPDCKENRSAWESACVGKISGWDECWLNITSLPLLQSLMYPRFQAAFERGCHAVELDNIDCFQNSDCYKKLGLSSALARTYQVAYNQWQLDVAHGLGLSVAMKNALDLVQEMGGQYDMAVNEQCLQYDECDMLQSFTASDKLVAHVEYEGTSSGVCRGDSAIRVSPRGKARSGATLMQSKWCNGSARDGVCNGSPWNRCFDPMSPLPPVQPLLP